MDTAEKFYDVLFEILRFRKSEFSLDGEKHIQYYNRHFGYVIRPALSENGNDEYAPGLHHVCFRVENEADVEEAARSLLAKNISVTAPRLFTEYADDYYATFLPGPDGLRLEITNYRAERRWRHDNWVNTDS